MKTIKIALTSYKFALVLRAIELLFKYSLMMVTTAVFIVLLFQLKSELGIDVFPNYNCPIDDFARSFLGL